MIGLLKLLNPIKNVSLRESVKNIQTGGGGKYRPVSTFLGGEGYKFFSDILGGRLSYLFNQRWVQGDIDKNINKIIVVAFIYDIGPGYIKVVALNL